MTRTTGAWVGIAATFVVVFGSLTHASHTDPDGRVESAYGAIHGVVIPPFRG
jgi:drug/metabolite transporter superfamily protein YnfA